MSFVVSLSDDAVADLDRLHGWIEGAVGSVIADEYDRDIRLAIRALSDFPHRGTPHRRGRSPVRTITFRRRQIIVYTVVDKRVDIVRILDAHRDWPRLLPA